MLNVNPLFGHVVNLAAHDSIQILDVSDKAFLNAIDSKDNDDFDLVVKE